MKLPVFTLILSAATAPLLLVDRAGAFDCVAQCDRDYWTCMGAPGVGGIPGTGDMTPLENGTDGTVPTPADHQMCLGEMHACIDRCVALGADEARGAPAESIEEFSAELSTLAEKFPELSARYLFFPHQAEQSE